MDNVAISLVTKTRMDNAASKIGKIKSNSAKLCLIKMLADDTLDTLQRWHGVSGKSGEILWEKLDLHEKQEIAEKVNALAKKLVNDSY